MSAPIVLTGLSNNDPVPGNYIEINFAQGPSAGNASDRAILLIGNMRSTGTAVADTTLYGPDTVNPAQTEGQVATLFGLGSELHRMFRQVSARNQVTKTYMIAVTESVGVAATGTITITGTAGANGTLRAFVADQFVEVSVLTGDTPTVTAASLVATLNAKTFLPVTASNAAGVVTLTAKQKGPRGNEIRFQSLLQFANGVSGVMAVTGGSDSALSGGTVADSNVNALLSVLPKRHYYIVSAANDATQLGAVSLQVDNQAAPLRGIRQRLFAGFTDTLPNGISLSTGLNQARAEIKWLRDSPLPSAELAASCAAIYALFEASAVPRTNYIGFGNEPSTDRFWQIPAPRTANAPTRSDIASALNGGLSPIAVGTNGKTSLVDRITTRSLFGSTADYRIRDAHKVTICDFFADDLATKTALNCSGFKIGDDPSPGAAPPPPGVMTPNLRRGQILGLIDVYDERGLLQKVAATKAGLVVQRETSPSSRLSSRIPLAPIDNLRQTADAIDQVA